jgi:NAD(P)-dependent dehydrogenase (short-subunit alcohol dehydrogenase family)
MKTYVITGGASGIGAAIAQQLREQGGKVLVVDIQQADIKADLSTAQGRESAVTAIRETAGNDLAGLVCCAGVGSHVPDRALITDVNYFGAVDLVEGLRVVLASNQAPVRLNRTSSLNRNSLT